MASALAVCAVSFAVADAAWFHPYLYKASSELFFVSLQDRQSARSVSRIPTALWHQWSDRTHEVPLAAYELSAGDLDVGQGPRPAVVVRLSTGTLSLLGFQPVVGRAFSESDEKAGNVAMLSHAAWADTYQSRADIAGHIVHFEGAALTIIGVTPPAFQLPLAPPTPALYLPLTSIPGDLTDLDAGQLTVIGRAKRLRPATDELFQRMAQYRLDRLAQTGDEVTIKLSHIADLVAPGARAVPMFVTLIVAILLLAWSNVAHLVTAECRAREREWAIRIALGAARTSVIARLAGLMCAVTAIAVALAWFAAWMMVEHFGAAIQSGLVLPRLPFVTPFVVWLTAATGCALAAGFIVVVLLSGARRPLTGALLAGETPTPAARLGIQRLVIGSQLLLAGCLVAIASIAGGLFVKLIDTIGLDPTDVITTSFAPRNPSVSGSAAIFADVENQLRRVPGIEELSFVDLLPFHRIMPSREEVFAAGDFEPAIASIRRVDAGYFNVLRIKILHGRGLRNNDMVSPPAVALVSRGLAARHWGRSDPLGQVIRVGDRPPLVVVGVTADVRDFQLRRAAEPTIYIPFSDRQAKRYEANRGILIRTNPQKAAETTREVESIMESLTPLGTHIRVSPMESRMGRGSTSPELYAWFTGICAWFALLMAGLGTYAICSHVAAQQQFAVAVRLACGASRLDILRHFAGFGALPIGGGLALGVLAGVLASDSLVRMVYTDAALGVIPTAAAVATLFLVSTAALMLPAYRASRHDPVKLLRV